MHLLDFAEFPFSLSTQSLSAYLQAATAAVESDPNNSDNLTHLGYARQAGGDIAGANSAYAALGQIAPDAILARVQLGVTPESNALELPPVIGEWPKQSCLFLSCDVRYLGLFVPPLLRSLQRFVPSQRIHIHIMGDPGDLKPFVKAFRPLRITTTQERPEEFLRAHNIQPEAYYGAARFIRFSQALDVNEGPLWMSDVDGLLYQNPRPLFGNAADVALRVRAGRLEPWNQFSACLVMGRPNARNYFREAANIVRALLTKSWWGLDQYALFSAYLILKARGTLPSFSLLGPNEANVGADEGGVFWYTAGTQKSRLFQNLPPEELRPYEKLFSLFSA